MINNHIGQIPPLSKVYGRIGARCIRKPIPSQHEFVGSDNRSYKFINAIFYIPIYPGIRY